jgi:hypothetical protein
MENVADAEAGFEARPEGPDAPRPFGALMKGGPGGGMGGGGMGGPAEFRWRNAMIDHHVAGRLGLQARAGLLQGGAEAARLQAADELRRDASGYGVTDHPTFWIQHAGLLGPDPGCGLAHVAFAAPDRKAVAAFYKVGVEARRQRQRQAGAAPGVPCELLRRVRARSRRSSHRGLLPPARWRKPKTAAKGKSCAEGESQVQIEIQIPQIDFPTGDTKTCR